jgi:hypothetical protein
MSAGPLVCAAGLLLLLRINQQAHYLTDVLPGVVVFGLGLALLVAPLTATVLAAADAKHAGVASGVNNAVARAASLIAVAVLPAASGLSGDDFSQPAAFLSGFHVALVICAVLLVAGGVLALATIRKQVAVTAPPPACGVAGTPLAVRQVSVDS